MGPKMLLIDADAEQRQVLIHTYYVTSDKLETLVSSTGDCQVLGQSAVCLHDDKVYFVGGRRPSGGEASRTALVYDSRTKRWSPLPDGHVSRYGGAAVGLKEHVYVAGGKSNGDKVLSGVQRLTVSTSVWSDVSPMNVGRCDHFSLLALKDRDILVAVGGDGEGGFGAVDVYNPIIDQWVVCFGDLSQGPGIGPGPYVLASKDDYYARVMRKNPPFDVVDFDPLSTTHVVPTKRLELQDGVTVASFATTSDDVSMCVLTSRGDVFQYDGHDWVLKVSIDVTDSTYTIT